MIDRVIALLEAELRAKETLLLNGTINSFEAYRVTLIEYKTLQAAIEIARNAEHFDNDEDDGGMEEIEL